MPSLYYANEARALVEAVLTSDTSSESISHNGGIEFARMVYSLPIEL